MAGITGQGDTFDLPNYVGELFAASPEDTKFLSAIGGLTGGMSVESTLFQWQGYDLRDAASDRQRLEGANAPTAEARVRYNVTNVVEIHQEALELSYTKLAARGQFASTGSAHTGSVGISGANPVQNEFDWQIEQHLKQIARDVNKSFLIGTFNNPADNSTARATRGLLSAISTNVIEAAGAVITETLVLDLLEMVWGNGGIMESETATVIVNSWLKRELTRIFVTDKNYREESRNVGGVNLTTFETDFGRLNIMLERHLTQGQLIVASLEDCAPVFLEVPGKGFLFVEPLAKVGAADRAQIYGEIGLKYGNEKKHGKIVDLDVEYPGS